MNMSPYVLNKDCSNHKAFCVFYSAFTFLIGGTLGDPHGGKK